MADPVSTNAGEVAADLLATGLRAGAAAVGVARFHGQLLLARARRNASLPRTGPPGPRLQTGDYLGSISLRVGLELGSVVAAVGTDRPQARRLEFGFSDTDSLGRVYDQDPMPHFGPALDETEQGFVAAVAALAMKR